MVGLRNGIKGWIGRKIGAPETATLRGRNSSRPGAPSPLHRGAVDEAEAPLGSLPPGTTLDSLRRLEKKSLFIVGCARSGTTALARALNRSPEIFLLEEPNFFANHHQRDFVEFFNDSHRGLGTPRMKGTYVRPAILPEVGPLPVLQRLSDDYRFVGGKIAIGPHDPSYDWRTAFVDYHARYFFHARRLLIIRSPAETLWSMHKMFGDRPIPLLFETWLKCVAMSIDSYRVFPNTRVLFFEELGPESIAQFGALLGLQIDIPPGMLDRQRYVQSQLSDGDLPPPLQPYAEWRRGCSEIYREIRDNFCRESLLYRGSRSEWDFFDDMLGRISELLGRVAKPPASPA